MRERKKESEEKKRGEEMKDAEGEREKLCYVFGSFKRLLLSSRNRAVLCPCQLMTVGGREERQ